MELSPFSKYCNTIFKLRVDVTGSGNTRVLMRRKHFIVTVKSICQSGHATQIKQGLFSLTASQKEHQNECQAIMSMIFRLFYLEVT